MGTLELASAVRANFSAGEQALRDEAFELSQLGSIAERQEHLAGLFTGYRARLRRMVDLRFDRRLRSLADPSDVLQEAFLQASRRLESYLKDPKLPLYLWVRFLAGQELLKLRRRHVGPPGRHAQLSLDRGCVPSASSQDISETLISKESTPSDLAVREEQRRLIQDALDGLESTDREVLVLKHFEQLSTVEVATLLGISQPAVRQRHARAASRFRKALKKKG